MDEKRREEFSIAWQRWCNSCESEWKERREAKEGRPFKSLEKLIDKELSALGVQERMVEDQLVEAWAEAVGPTNAMHSRPVSLNRGELIVAVTQPALKFDLERFHKGEILKRMQARFGATTIRRLRFRVGN